MSRVKPGTRYRKLRFLEGLELRLPVSEPLSILAAGLLSGLLADRSDAQVDAFISQVDEGLRSSKSSGNQPASSDELRSIAHAHPAVSAGYRLILPSVEPTPAVPQPMPSLSGEDDVPGARHYGASSSAISAVEIANAVPAFQPVHDADTPAIPPPNRRLDAEFPTSAGLPTFLIADASEDAGLGAAAPPSTGNSGDVSSALSVPDHPSPLQFNPNSIKDIATAEPAAGIDLIAPPTANNQGTADVTFPIEFPAGRGAFSPELALTYSSARGNGWLGVGWDLSVPRIEVDTRWGVPAYDGSERFLLNGEALVPVPNEPGLDSCAIDNATVVGQFAPRRESFERILLCHSDANGSHWEVTAKDGTRFEYGTPGPDDELHPVPASSRLSSYQKGEEDHVAAWSLSRVVDTNGNVARYQYTKDLEESTQSREGYTQTYLSKIAYTSNDNVPAVDAAYEVTLTNEAIQREDEIVSGRTGFRVMTQYRLGSIEVTFGEETVRRYELTYKPGGDPKVGGDPEVGGAFGKSLLESVTVFGADGDEFYEHTFEYSKPAYKEPSEPGEPQERADPFVPEIWGPTSTGINPTDQPNRLLSRTAEESHSVGLGLSLGVSGCEVGIGGKVTWESPTPAVVHVDIDGDRIVDRVWLDGNVVKAILGSSIEGNFGDPISAQNIPYIGAEEAKGGMVSGSAACLGQSISVAFSVRESDADSLLTDVDGDGITDLALVGAYYRGLPATCRDNPSDDNRGPCSDGLSVRDNPLQLQFSDLASTQAINSPPSTTANSGRRLMEVLKERAQRQLQATEDSAPSQRNDGDTIPQSREDDTSGFGSATPGPQPQPAPPETEHKATPWGHFTAKEMRLQAEAEAGPPLNPVIRWDAPFAGDVNVTARARRKYVGLAYRFYIEDSGNGPLQPPEIPDWFSTAFQKSAPLSDAATLELIESGRKWRITDGQAEYLLELAGNTYYVYSATDGVDVTLLKVTDPNVSTETERLGTTTLSSLDWVPLAGSGSIASLEFEDSLLVVLDTLEDAVVDDHGHLLDEIEVEIHVEYTNVCNPNWDPFSFETVCHKPDITLRDDSGELAYVFDYPADFRTSELPREEYWYLVPPIGPPQADASSHSEAKNRIEGTATRIVDTGGPIHVRIRCERLSSNHARDGAYDGDRCTRGSVLEDWTLDDESTTVNTEVESLPSAWRKVDDGEVSDDPSRPVAIVRNGLVLDSPKGLNNSDTTIAVDSERMARFVKEALPKASVLHPQTIDFDDVTPGLKPGDLYREQGVTFATTKIPDDVVIDFGVRLRLPPNETDEEFAIVLGGEVAISAPNLARAAGNGPRDLLMRFNPPVHFVDLTLDNLTESHNHDVVRLIGLNQTESPNEYEVVTIIEADADVPAVRMSFRSLEPVSFAIFETTTDVEGFDNLTFGPMPRPERSLAMSMTQEVIDAYVTDYAHASTLFFGDPIENSRCLTDDPEGHLCYVAHVLPQSLLDSDPTYAYDPYRLLFEVDGENGAEVPPATVQWHPSVRIVSTHDIDEVRQPTSDTPVVLASNTSAIGNSALTTHDLDRPDARIRFSLDESSASDAVAKRLFPNAQFPSGYHPGRTEAERAFIDTVLDRAGVLGFQVLRVMQGGDDAIVVEYEALSEAIANLETIVDFPLPVQDVGITLPLDVERDTNFLGASFATAGLPTSAFGHLRALVRDSASGEPLNVYEYEDLNRDELTVAYERDSLAELALSQWPSDRKTPFDSIDAALQAMLLGEENAPDALIADAAYIREKINVPEVGSQAFVCCRRGDPHDIATEVATLKQGAVQFIDPESPWIDEPPVLYRVHPARELVSFTNPSAGPQELRVTVDVTNLRYEMIVTVTSEDADAPLMTQRVPAQVGASPTNVFSVTLPSKGEYYVRAYTDAGFDPLTRIDVRAQLVDVNLGLPHVALVQSRLQDKVHGYEDLEPTLGQPILVVAGSSGERVAHELFPNAQSGQILALKSSDDVLTRLKGENEATAAIAEESQINNWLANDPEVARVTFKCCPPGDDVKPILRNPEVPTNVLFPKFGGGHRFQQFIPDVRTDMYKLESGGIGIFDSERPKREIGEVPHSFDPWGGGHHGFFYGQLLGGSKLACIGSICDDDLELQPDDDGGSGGGEGDDAASGDTDADRDVDLDDLNRVRNDFGCVGPQCPGDVNGDGRTDDGDVTSVRENFGRLIAPKCGDADDGDRDGDGVPDLCDETVYGPNGGPDDQVYKEPPPGDRLTFTASGPTAVNGTECFVAGDAASRTCGDGTNNSARENSNSRSEDGSVDGALRRSQNFGTSIDIGTGIGSLGVNSSFGWGSSYTELEYMDWNGDGIPDIVSPNTIELGLRDDPLIVLGLQCEEEFDSKCIVYPGVRESKNATNGLAANLGGGAKFQHKTTAGGRAKELSWDDIGGGIGFHVQTSEASTFSDRFDINGDGLPDLIWAGRKDDEDCKEKEQEESCDVPHLYVRLNLGYRLGVEEDWGAIGASVEEELPRSSEITHTSSLTTGTSVGISASVSIGIVELSASLGRSDDVTIAETPFMFADINGDGLADLVTKLKQDGKHTFSVRMNTGTSLAAETTYMLDEWAPPPSTQEIVDELELGGAALGGLAANALSGLLHDMPDGVSVSGSDTYTISGSIGVRIFFVKVSVSYHHTGGYSFVEMGLQDVTGDGLPDRILRGGEENPDGAIQVQENRLGGANLLKTIHRPLGGRIDLRYRELPATADDPNTRWVLSRSTLQNDVGYAAVTPIVEMIEYKRPEENASVMRYYDRFEREFYGFETVTTTTFKKWHDVEKFREPSRINVVTYANRGVDVALDDPGDGGDSGPNLDYWLRNLVLKRETLDPESEEGDFLVKTENAFTAVPRHDSNSTRVSCLENLNYPQKWLDNETTNDSRTTPCDVWFVSPLKTTTTWREGGVEKATIQNYEYDDDFGNLTQVREQNDILGDDEVARADDLITMLAYDHHVAPGTEPTPHQAALFAAHIVDLVHSVDVRQAGPVGTRLRYREAAYDDRGNLTLHETWADAEGTKKARMSFEYDPTTGFLTVARDDRAGYEVTYAPDPVLHMFPETTSDSLGLVSTTAYNFRFQLPESQTDANGKIQTTTYDQFGRLKTVTGPYEREANEASVSVTYVSATKTAPARAITTNVAVDLEPPATTIRVAVFVDALGRTIQTQTDANVNDVVGRIISGRVEFDAAGRLVKQGQPVFKRNCERVPTPECIPKETDSISFVDVRNEVASSDERSTRWQYDALDRIVKMTEPGGRETTTSYAITDRPDGEPGIKSRQTKIEDPLDKVRYEYRDASDRLVAVGQVLGDDELVTAYDYQPTDELIEIKDARDNVTTLKYDLAGRRTAISTPDTGRTEFGYDDSGNLVTKTDQVLCDLESPLLPRCIGDHPSNDKVITYTYKMNRLESIQYPDQSLNVTFTYGDDDGDNVCDGENVRGRICKIVDQAGEELISYGALGEVVKRSRETRGAPWLEGMRTFVTAYVYDSFGRMLSLRYPDGEELTYTYDAGGRVDSLKSEATTYVADIDYDEFGQRTRLEYGNEVTTTYMYEPDTRRLSHEEMRNPATQGATDPLAEKDYTYDLVGNVMSANDTRNWTDASNVDRGYTYDDLHRIETFSIDAMPSVAGKPETNVSGRFSYDEVGNLLSQTVEIDGTSESKYPARDWTYAPKAPGAPQPNLPETIGPYSYTYDKRGSILTTLGGGSEGVPAGATYTWDANGRLSSSQREGAKSSLTKYLYNSDGQRVRKETLLDPNDSEGNGNASVYPNEFYSAQFTRNRSPGCDTVPCGDEATRSKHIYIDGQRIATVVTNVEIDPSLEKGEDELEVLKPPVASYYHSDPVASVTLLTDQDGNVAQTIDYLPFGEVLFESGSAEVPQAFRFDGKELDPETGLQYFGARYYDPRIGRWISADPLYRFRPERGLHNPLQGSLHGFALNNPVRLRDATGLDACSDESCTRMNSRGMGPGNETVDAQSRNGRDPFARPGAPGNRGMKFGRDAVIPQQYRSKVERAAALAYELNNKDKFRQVFQHKVTKLAGMAGGTSKTYLDTLDAITLNLADSSNNPIVKRELSEASAARQEDSMFQVEPGFSIPSTGAVFIRESVLKSWSAEQLAGLLVHEAAHVAGAPAHIISELELLTLDQVGYRRRDY